MWPFQWTLCRVLSVLKSFPSFHKVSWKGDLLLRVTDRAACFRLSDCRDFAKIKQARWKSDARDLEKRELAGCILSPQFPLVFASLYTALHDCITVSEPGIGYRHSEVWLRDFTWSLVISFIQDRLNKCIFVDSWRKMVAVGSMGILFTFMRGRNTRSI